MRFVLIFIWGYDFYGDERTIDTHIKMLRQSIKEYGDYIKLATSPTLYGSFKAELYDSEYNNLLTRTLKFRTNDYHYDKNTETFSFSDSIRFWFA